MRHETFYQLLYFIFFYFFILLWSVMNQINWSSFMHAFIYEMISLKSCHDGLARWWAISYWTRMSCSATLWTPQTCSSSMDVQLPRRPPLERAWTVWRLESLALSVSYWAINVILITIVQTLVAELCSSPSCDVVPAIVVGGSPWQTIPVGLKGEETKWPFAEWRLCLFYIIHRYCSNLLCPVRLVLWDGQFYAPRGNWFLYTIAALSLLL